MPLVIVLWANYLWHCLYLFFRYLSGPSTFHVSLVWLKISTEGIRLTCRIVKPCTKHVVDWFLFSICFWCTTLWFSNWLRVCLDPKFLYSKTSHRMFGRMREVLNEVYLQNFLHGWVINRETNLMSLLNPWFATVMLQWPSANYKLIRVIKFVSRFTTHLCKKFCK